MNLTDNLISHVTLMLSVFLPSFYIESISQPGLGTGGHGRIGTEVVMRWSGVCTVLRRRVSHAGGPVPAHTQQRSRSTLPDRGVKPSCWTCSTAADTCGRADGWEASLCEVPTQDKQDLIYPGS